MAAGKNSLTASVSVRLDKDSTSAPVTFSWDLDHHHRPLTVGVTLAATEVTPPPLRKRCLDLAVDNQLWSLRIVFIGLFAMCLLNQAKLGGKYVKGIFNSSMSNSQGISIIFN